MLDFKNKISSKVHWLYGFLVELAKSDPSSGFYIYSPEEPKPPGVLKSLEFMSIDPCPPPKS